MNSITFLAAPAVQSWPKRYALYPLWLQRLCREADIVLGNPCFIYFSPMTLTSLFLLSVSCGNGRVTTAVGAKRYWEPLVTDLHSGGQGRLVAFFSPRLGHTSAATLTTEQPYLSMHCSPMGLEKMA